MRKCFEREFFVGDEMEIRIFANRIGDNNPLHHSDEAARKAGLLGIIVPGVMVVGFVSSTIAAEIPGVMVRKLEVEFTNPVYACNFATVFCNVSRQRDRLALVTITVSSRQQVVAEGSCTLFLPRAAEGPTALAA